MKVVIFIGLLLVLFVAWVIGYIFLDPSTFSNEVECTILSTIWGIGVLMIPCIVCFIIFKPIKLIWEPVRGQP